MQVLKVTATGLAYTGHASVSSVSLVPGSDAASVRLTDGLTDTGVDKGGAKTGAAASTESMLGSAMFVTGIFVTLSGTNAVAYIYVD